VIPNGGYWNHIKNNFTTTTGEFMNAEQAMAIDGAVRCPTKKEASKKVKKVTQYMREKKIHEWMKKNWTRGNR
jgi:hypothetical protein